MNFFSKKTLFFLVLVFSLFLLSSKTVFAAGTLPTVPTDAKLKLFNVGGINYLAFSSSTVSGDYNVYLTTSTSGAPGTWSSPSQISSAIKPSQNDHNGFFGFDYNEADNYFGLAWFASSTWGDTNEIQFTSSTDGVTWSSPQIVDQDLPFGDGYRRNIFLDFSSDGDLIAVGYTGNDISAKVGFSTDGVNWTGTQEVAVDGGQSFQPFGLEISGTSTGARFNLAYYVSTDSNNSLVFARSSDNVGSTWNATTVDQDFLYTFSDPEMGTAGMDYFQVFNLDDNEQPRILYGRLTDITIVDPNSPPFPATGTLYYAAGNSDGSSWTTTSIFSDFNFVSNNLSERNVDLIFIGGTHPVFSGILNNSYPNLLANTSTDWAQFSLGSYPLSEDSRLSSALDSGDYTIGTAYVLADGTLSFSTTSVPFDHAPATPTNLVLTPTTSTIIFSWDAVSGADSYFVESSINDAGDATTSTSFTFSSLFPNTGYSFQVSAINAFGTSTISAVTSTYTSSVGNYFKNSSFEAWDNEDPNIPDDFMTNPYGESGSPTSSESLVSRTGDTSIFMVEDGGSGLLLQQGVSGLTPSATITASAWAKHSVGDHVSIIVLNDVSSPSLVWNFTDGVWESLPEGDLTADEKYTYQLTTTDWEEVNTNNAAHQSVVPENGIIAVYFLNVDSDLYLDDVSLVVNGVPSAPTNFTLDNAGPGYLDLSWTDNASDEDGFVLGVSTDGVDYTYYDYGSYGPNISSLTRDELSVNTPYWLKIGAYNTYGTSTYDTLDEVYTAPYPPGDPEVSNVSTSSIDVAWSDNSNPTTTVYYVAYNGGFVTTTATSTTVTGLTPSTSYQFAVRSQYLSSSTLYTAYSASSTATTTLSIDSSDTTPPDAPIISTPSQTVDANSISIIGTAEAGSTIIITGGASTASGVATGGNFSVSVSLTQNASNVLSVVAVDASSNTSTASSVTITEHSSSGGGGGSGKTTVTPPTLLNNSISVAGGTTVKSNIVTLLFNVSGASSVAMSEDPAFSGVSWQPYESQKTFVLSSEVGAKIIYIKFRSSDGGTTEVYQIKLNLIGSTETQLPIKTISSLTELVVVDENSDVVIVPPTAVSFQPGAALKFSYSYKNKSAKPLSVRVTRQLLSSADKVVRSSAAYQILKTGGVFARKVNEAVSSNLAAGDYTVKINIYNSRTNQLLSSNAFGITIEKLKKKYFIFGADMPMDTDIAFDSASWSKVKSNVTLPTTLKLKYSYTNNSGAKHVVRMVRELVNADGKVLSSRSSRWTMAIGEKDAVSFTQALDKNLIAGTYQIRIRAYDWTTKELLAENSAEFVAELK